MNNLFPIVFLLIYISVILTVILYHVLKLYEHTKIVEQIILTHDIKKP